MILAISISLAVASLLVLLALREASREAESCLPLKPERLQSWKARAAADLAPRKPMASSRPAEDTGKSKAL